MEEDIVYLKELLALAKMFLNNNSIVTIQDKEIQVLENILNELERLQKENEALQMTHDYDVKTIDEVKGEYVKLSKEFEVLKDKKCLHCGENTPLYCENCYQELITKNGELQLKYEVFIETNYIPKTVIRDRITDLEEVKSKYNFLIGTSYRADGAINTLKELLGE